MSLFNNAAQNFIDMVTSLHSVPPRPSTTNPSDLEILYESKCPIIGTFFYCKNLKLDGVFKYIVQEPTVYRTQCNCCTYDHSKNDDLPRPLTMEDLNQEKVDEESKNKLLILPTYSKFCGINQRIVVFAAVYPNDRLESLIFNSTTGKFETNPCQCLTCKHPLNFQDSHFPGQQQLSYARTHLDQAGGSLVCLSIDWYDVSNGKISVFSNRDGDIGRYQYDKENQCYQLIELLDVRVHEALKNPKARVLFDDELAYCYSHRCPTRKQLILFAYHRISESVEKLTFNPLYNQFEAITCPCCEFQWKKMSDATILGMYQSVSTGGDVFLMHTKDFGIEKNFMVGDAWMTMGRSPIRDLRHETLEDFKVRQAQEKTPMSTYSVATDEELNEYYSLDDKLVVDMAGNISYSPKSENTKKLQKPRELLDSHLIPETVGYCNHLNTVAFSASNHLSPGVSNYIFDCDKKEIRQIHCCEAKGEEVLYGEILTISKEVFLISGNVGQLVKMCFDEETQEMRALPEKKVVRRFKYEDVGQESPQPQIIDLFKNFLNLTYPKPSTPEPFSLEVLEHFTKDSKDLEDSEDVPMDSGAVVDSEGLNDDVESTVTALEPSDVEEDSEDQDSDAESTATALEPSDDEDSDDSDSEDQDSDAESTATALEPSDDEDCGDEDSEDVESTATALDHSDAEEDSEDDISDAESTATALEPFDVDDSESNAFGDNYPRFQRSAHENHGFQKLDEEDDVESPKPELYERKYRAQMRASCFDFYLIRSGKRLPSDSDAESTATALEPSGDEDSDAEPTATALEPSGDEESDSESTATAQEPSDVEDSGDEDSDAESTATALEPSDVKDSEPYFGIVDHPPRIMSYSEAVKALEHREDSGNMGYRIDEYDVDVSEDEESDSEDSEDQDSDAESTATALEPSGDQDLEFKHAEPKKSLMEEIQAWISRLMLLLEPTVSVFDVEDSGDVDSDAESTATALEPEEFDDSDILSFTTDDFNHDVDCEESDSEDVESVATALEPSDDEDSDSWSVISDRASTDDLDSSVELIDWETDNELN